MEKGRKEGGKEEKLPVTYVRMKRAREKKGGNIICRVRILLCWQAAFKSVN